MEGATGNSVERLLLADSGGDCGAESAAVAKGILATRTDLFVLISFDGARILQLSRP